MQINKAYALKIKFVRIQFEKAHFILVNELKLTEVELFSLFRFRSATITVSKLFCANAFYTTLTFHISFLTLNIFKFFV